MGLTMSESETGFSLLIEQRRRWHQDDCVRVEAYLESHPEVRANPETVLELIYNEIVLREEKGDVPRLDEYLERFPHLDDQIRLQFDLHQAVQAERLAATSIREAEDTALRPKSRPGQGCRVEAIAGYEIRQELGRGGMGVVYQAWQRDLKRPVALKMILAGDHASARTRARFRTEAEAVARLQHPNIVQIYEIGEHEGRSFIALEFVEGGSLDRHLGGTPQAAVPAAHLVEALARAMHYAHEQGIILRDLKPQNILLAPNANPQKSNPKSEIRNPKQIPITKEEYPKREGAALAQIDRRDLGDSGFGIVSTCDIRISDLTFGISNFFPKITDFGLAKLVDADSGVTPSEAFVGTPNYMAPEQAEGKGRMTHPTVDVYALGAILYELVTGRPPFKGTTVAQTLEQVRTQEPVPPSRLQPRLPRDLETICLKCLEKDPGRRYASALELAEDLRRFQAQEPIRARPVSWGERGIKFARRRPAVAGLIAVSLTALICGLGLVAWHYEDLQVQVRQAKTRATKAERLVQQERQKTMAAQLAKAKAHHQAQDRFCRFVKERDEALFYGIYKTLFPDQSVPPSRQAARKALDLAGAWKKGDRALANSRYLENGQAQEIQETCYELFLILAESVAGSAAGQTGEQQKKRAQQALRLLDRAAQFGSPTRAFYRRRARYLGRIGDERGKNREEKQAEQLQPDSAMDFFLLGDEQFRHGNAPQALRNFEETLRRRPDHFWGQYYLSLCYLAMHRPAEAKVGLPACLSRRPDFLWTYLLRGFANQRLKDWKAAEADFHKASLLGPNEHARYILLVSRGLVYYDQNRFPAAEAELRRAIALRPNRPAAYLNLSWVYRKQHKWTQALEQLEHAERLQPPVEILANIHLERGRIYYGNKNYAAALKAWAGALKASPGFAPAHYWRGRALLGRQRFKEAARAFDAYLQHGGQPNGDVYRGRGHARTKAGDLLGSLEDYTQALYLHPDAEIYAHRGWAYFFLDAWRLALADFEKALRLDPDYGDAYTGRGLARVMLGQFEEAVADARQALDLGPETPEMMHNNACIFALAIDKVMRAASKKLDRQLLARDYRKTALDTIRQTLAMLRPEERGPFWRTTILPDVALRTLHDCPQFHQWTKQYSQPAR
jgi:serine/threonine protein kinase/Tfp pilus assembly protein PilF